MTSEFTEHLPGSNKVHYPISGRNDFTVLLRSVVGQQYYIYENYPLYTMYDVFLKKFILLMEVNLQESTDWFKASVCYFLSNLYRPFRNSCEDYVILLCCH